MDVKVKAGHGDSLGGLNFSTYKEKNVKIKRMSGSKTTWKIKTETKMQVVTMRTDCQGSVKAMKELIAKAEERKRYKITSKLPPVKLCSYSRIQIHRNMTIFQTILTLQRTIL